MQMSELLERLTVLRLLLCPARRQVPNSDFSWVCVELCGTVQTPIQIACNKDQVRSLAVVSGQSPFTCQSPLAEVASVIIELLLSAAGDLDASKQTKILQLVEK